MNAAEGALLSACEAVGAWRSRRRGRACPRGCERGPDGVAPEKPGVAHAASARMGVAPRGDANIECDIFYSPESLSASDSATDNAI